jgi:hypothetical protein
MMTLVADVQREIVERVATDPGFDLRCLLKARSVCRAWSTWIAPEHVEMKRVLASLHRLRNGRLTIPGIFGPFEIEVVSYCALKTALVYRPHGPFPADVKQRTVLAWTLGFLRRTRAFHGLLVPLWRDETDSPTCAERWSVSVHRLRQMGLQMVNFHVWSFPQ